MNVKTSTISRSAGLMAGTFVALASAYAAPAPAVETTDFNFENNYIKMSYSPVKATGSESAFQAATQQHRSSAGGIEELRFGKELGQDLSLQIDGKALTSVEDYLGKIKLTKSELGSFEAGFQRFRTYYDGVGGFFPTNGAWMPLADSFLHVDRQKIWAEFNYKDGDGPAFRLRYTNDLRTGNKDSTIWGQTDYTGIANPTYTGNAVARAIVANYMNLNDRQQTLEGSVSKEFGHTKIEAGFIGNKVNNDDTRYVNRYPNELRPYPAITRNIPASKANNPVWGYFEQKVDTKTLALYSKFESKINAMITLFGGVKYSKTTGSTWADQNMSSTIATTGTPITARGAVAYTVNANTGVATAANRPPYSYMSADAGSLKEEVTTANLGANLKPLRDLFVTVALKAEHEEIKTNNKLIYYATQVNPVKNTATSFAVNTENWGREKETSWVPELSFRYSGIRTVSVYGTFEYRRTPGTERFSYTSASASGLSMRASTTTGSSDITENHGNYKVGATWAPHSMVLFRAEGFMKSHENSFADALSSGEFVLNYDTKGVTGSVTLTPFATLSGTTKLVIKQGSADTIVNAGTPYQANDTKTNLIGQSIDWTPTKDFYFQGNVNVAFDSTITSYPRSGGIGNWVLRNADNNYWNGSVLAGMVIDKNTDGQVQYSYYKADNYRPAEAATMLPYGAGQEDSMVTVGVKHKFSDKLIGEAKVGYVHSKNATTGGNTNYSGTIGYVSLAYAF